MLRVCDPVVSRADCQNRLTTYEVHPTAYRPADEVIEWYATIATRCPLGKGLSDDQMIGVYIRSIVDQ